MGIRIKKALVWALPDVQVENLRIVDPRFSESFLADEQSNDDRHEWRNRATFAQFLDWLKSNKDEAVAVLGSQDPSKFGHSAQISFILHSHGKDGPVERTANDFIFEPVYDTEFGIPEVFGFVAGLEKNYIRRDDTLDYYTEAKFTPKHESPPNWIDWQPCGIYPWLGMVHMPIGEQPAFANEEQGRDWQMLMPAEYQMMVGEFAEKHSPSMGYEIAEYLKIHYRPIIPPAIVLWTHWLGDRLWADWNSTVNQLRPAMYTYWS
tara:strand:+ start:63186 stop:63974 length:789 start_codon:yes stop_codon:yes gene_type:complete